MPSLFRLNQFVVGVNGNPLLSAIDLEIQSGELVAITGPSGCGKTTLLRAAAGLIDANSGDVQLDGKDANEIGHPVFRRQVVLVNQQPVVLDTTVEENLRRPFQYQSSDTEFDSDNAVALIRAMNLDTAIRNQNARSLSVGEQQRVCLVRALLIEPSVLLMDEPTSALDGDSVNAVETIIRNEIHERKIAGIAVTHNVEQADRWCDRTFDLKPLIAK